VGWYRHICAEIEGFRRGQRSRAGAPSPPGLAEAAGKDRHADLSQRVILSASSRSPSPCPGDGARSSADSSPIASSKSRRSSSSSSSSSDSGSSGGWDYRGGSDSDGSSDVCSGLAKQWDYPGSAKDHEAAALMIQRRARGYWVRRGLESQKLASVLRAMRLPVQAS
jgi:hypothetical protein